MARSIFRAWKKVGLLSLWDGSDEGRAAFGPIALTRFNTVANVFKDKKMTFPLSAFSCNLSEKHHLGVPGQEGELEEMPDD
jgi:hypothetical protein